METIWKFPLEVTDEQVIMLPKHSTILTVQTQKPLGETDLKPMLWASVDPTEKGREPAKIRMFGTGHPIEDGFEGVYLSTIQLLDGALVFHVFVEL